MNTKKRIRLSDQIKDQITSKKFADYTVNCNKDMTAALRKVIFTGMSYGNASIQHSTTKQAIYYQLTRIANIMGIKEADEEKRSK